MAEVNIVEAPTEDDSLIYACTYTDNEILAHIPKGEHGEGIYAWSLNGKTGKLTGPLAVNEITPNPAFLLKHPTKDVIYASTECIHKKECGEIISLVATPDGGLQELGRVSAGGRSTCYLTMHKSNALMAAVNYWDAIVTLLPVNKSDGVVKPVCNSHMQPGAQYVFDNNPDRVEHWTHRQRWPHTHCFVTEPYNKRFHFVPDLGEDKIWWYSIDTTKGAGTLKLHGGVQLKKEQGPRHAVFHPRVRSMYIVNELKSTVSVLKYQEKVPDSNSTEVLEEDSTDPSATLAHFQTIRTLPDDFESNDHHKSHASEIRLHPSGKYLFIANRGHDSIVIYSIDETDDGKLTLVSITPSGGIFPRNFNFAGKFVVVGNQNSNNLTVFDFDMCQGTMKVVDTVSQPSPNFIFALPAGSLSGPTTRISMRVHLTLLVIFLVFWIYAAFFVGHRADL